MSKKNHAKKLPSAKELATKSYFLGVFITLIIVISCYSLLHLYRGVTALCGSYHVTANSPGNTTIESLLFDKSTVEITHTDGSVVTCQYEIKHYTDLINRRVIVYDYNGTDVEFAFTKQPYIMFFSPDHEDWNVNVLFDG